MKECNLDMTLQNNNINIAIFASGSGSNAQALIEKAHLLGKQISCLITDQIAAGVIQKAQQLDTPVYVIPFTRSKDHSYPEDKKLHEKKILDILKERKVNWIFLAGYMRILSQSFLQEFYNNQTHKYNVINIHPSLLPAFPGKQAYKDAYETNVKESGITVHFVDDGIDTGPIIAQEKFSRKESDSLEDFSSRGLALEHKLYPHILEQLYTNPQFLSKGLL